MGSKRTSRSKGDQALPSSVKGRPSKNRSVRMSQAGQGQKRAQRKVSHSAYRDINIAGLGTGSSLGGGAGAGNGAGNGSRRGAGKKPGRGAAVSGGRRTSGYGSSLPNIDGGGYLGAGSGAGRGSGSGSGSGSGREGARRGSSNEPLRSVSVSQVRSNQRRAQQQQPKKSRKGLIIGIIAVVVALVVAAGIFIMSRSDLFPVTKITVSGVRHLTQQETAQLAAVSEGTTLINIDAAGIESRLESSPWILDAVVERRFPDTVNLNITERQIVAVVDVVIDDNDNQQTWALASDGTWLMEIPDRNSPEGQTLAPQVYEDVDAALHIQSVPYGSVPEAGTQCNNPNITNALAIIDGMSTELADQVKSVSAASSDSTVLTLQNGVEIAFGDSSDIRDKERVCLELMEQYPNKIAYINVRVVNKPIWRAV